MNKRNIIINFYLGKETDDKHRFLSDILKYSDDQLESYHDFIQWLFPLETESQYNLLAPLIDKEIRYEFSKNVILQDNLCKSCSRMLHFYGFLCGPPLNIESIITCDMNFTKKAENWLSPNNHNHLRLTRILRSLRLLSLEKCSSKLLLKLEEIALQNPHKISKETLHFWQKTQ
ncbi:MAG: hypothetical protein HQK91_01720 [Nitrospirae bacterium]|nr:hypothetical protein [Nitrospirota bacterium]